MNATLTFTAGRLLCRHVRDILSQYQVMGANIKWVESSGWIERDFLIRGDDDSVLKIKQVLEKWAQDNNLGYTSSDS